MGTEISSARPLRQIFIMMTMLALAAMLIGIVLGLRFKVSILAPAIFIGSAAVLGLTVANSNSLWTVLLAVALEITALQIGYVGGTFIRWNKKPVTPLSPT